MDRPDSPVDAPAEVLQTTDPRQLKALAHPLRNRILFALGPDGSTVSQLAKTLSTNKGNVAHHLAVLEGAELVRRGARRQVRGGTEQYFVRAARRLRTPGGSRAGHTAALLQAVAEEIVASPTDSLLTLRRIRLTRVQAAALSQHRARLVEERPAAGSRAPDHGVLVSVFRASPR